MVSASILTQYASDVISFVVEDIPHVAIANEKSVSRFGVSDCNQPVVIYAYDKDNLDWYLLQSIVAPCIIDLDVFAIDGMYDNKYKICSNVFFLVVHD